MPDKGNENVNKPKPPPKPPPPKPPEPILVKEADLGPKKKSKED